MKRMMMISIMIAGLLATYGHAQMHEGMMGSGTMMGGQSQEQTGQMPYGGWYYPCPQMTAPGMMGYGGHMGSGMMGYGMGPGMMGYGMGPGMMGYGMGPGMMWGYNAAEYQKFLNDTADLRKKLHNKKFEYFELMRNPNTKPDAVTKIQEEIFELQNKIYKKSLK